MNYLDELNPSQRVAVEHIVGPSMVIAGAGSGKTRVLTYRIAHMLEQGIDPFNILALTFTNKAASEMKERIKKILSSQSFESKRANEAQRLTMGTFHSVFSRILRIHAEKLGFQTNFTIYDTEDSVSMIKTVLNDLQLDVKTYKPKVVLHYISEAKNQLQSYKEYQAYEQNALFANHYLEVGRIFKHYVKRCKQANAMDFDDLLYYTHVLLKTYPEVLSLYQHKFQYILVDEYQDTNWAQYSIIKMLAAAYENICVVGDDAQSIYSFRGADIENIFRFQKDYPDHRLFKLEQNYRSTQTIVEAANSVINYNKEQIKKNLWTSNDSGQYIRVLSFLNNKEEGREIAYRIFNLKKETGCSYKDFAILYRANYQTRSFEEALRILNIPYKIYAGMSFYQRREIKDTLAYFRLSINHSDEEAFKRIINYPTRGVGKTSVEKIIIASNEHNVSIWQIVENIRIYNLPISARTIKIIEDFVTMINSFSAQLNKLSAYELGTYIVKNSGIAKDLHDAIHDGPEEVERYQNLEELLNSLQSFVVSKQQDNENNETATLIDFVNDVALLTTADTADAKNEDHVSLMTVHTSKGLEFPHVFIGGLEENLFPIKQAYEDKKALEEERRLFYVALTRAMKTCTMSYAITRFRVGYDSSKYLNNEPSSFLSEISSEYIRYETFEQAGGRSLNQQNALQLKGFKRSENRLTPIDKLNRDTNKNAQQTLKVGDNVLHESFGKGRITKIEGVDPDKKAFIFFPGYGMRTMLLRFAKLEVIR